MKKAAEKMVNISASIPYSLAKRLEKASKEHEHSKSYYVKKALEEYLEDLEDYVDGMKAYAEYVKSGKKSVSAAEVFKHLD